MYLPMYYRRAVQFSIVILVINETQCRNCSRMIREIQPLTKLDEVEENIGLNENFIRSIHYVIPGENYFCIALSGDKSLFHERTVAALQHYSQALVVSEGVNPLRCNATLVAVEDATGLRRAISTLPFWMASRYYFVVRNSTLDILERMFRDNTTVFKEAEVAIAVYKHDKQVLQFNPPTPGLNLIDVPASGHWAKTVVSLKTDDEIRFTTGNCDLHSFLRHNGTDYNFGGVEWKIFDSITRRMGLRRKFVHSVNLTYLGDYNGTSWTGGLLGKVVNDEVDVGFCSLWIERRKFGVGIEMTTPYNQVCIAYIVPRPKVTPRVTIRSFSKTVTICNMLTIILSVTTMKYLTRSTKYFVPSTNAGYRSWTYCFMTAFGILLQGNYPAQSKDLGSVRLALYSLLMTSSFSSQLVSNFSSVTYSPKPKNLKDLVDFGYSNPYLGSPPYPWGGVLDQSDPYAEKWIERGEPVSDFGDLVRRLKSKPKQSFIGSVYEGKIFIPMTPMNIPRDVLSNYEVMDSCIGGVFEGFAFHQGSRFLKHFNWYVDYFNHFGLIKKTYRDAFRKVGGRNPAYWDVMIKSGTSHKLKPLSLTHLFNVFRSLLIGHIVALVAFIGEIYHHHIYRQRVQSFHQ